MRFSSFSDFLVLLGVFGVASQLGFRTANLRHRLWIDYYTSGYELFRLGFFFCFLLSSPLLFFSPITISYPQPSLSPHRSINTCSNHHHILDINPIYKPLSSHFHYFIYNHSHIIRSRTIIIACSVLTGHFFTIFILFLGVVLVAFCRIWSRYIIFLLVTYVGCMLFCLLLENICSEWSLSFKL